MDARGGPMRTMRSSERPPKPYSRIEEEKSPVSKNIEESDGYHLLGDIGSRCHNEDCKKNEYDYNKYVFELLQSLVQKHDEQFEEEKKLDEESVSAAIHAKFLRSVDLRTPMLNSTIRMESDLTHFTSTPKKEISTRIDIINFSENIFNEEHPYLKYLRTLDESKYKFKDASKVGIKTINREYTLLDTYKDGNRVKLTIEREDKEKDGKIFQRAIYFKFYINNTEYFHCTFITSDKLGKRYCTSLHYTTRIGGKAVYVYIDLDIIIKLFKECRGDIIQFLILILGNFSKEGISRKFNCFLGIIACNAEIKDASLIKYLINFAKAGLERSQAGGKLKNRKKLTKPKTTTTKPKTPKTTTPKPKTPKTPKTTTTKPKTSKTTTPKPKTPKTTTTKPKTPKATTTKPKTPKTPKTTTTKPKTTKATTTKPKTPKTTTAKPKTK
jgi:hypothetical protein